MTDGAVAQVDGVSFGRALDTPKYAALLRYRPARPERPANMALVGSNR
jgi:hypothetical protein